MKDPTSREPIEPSHHGIGTVYSSVIMALAAKKKGINEGDAFLAIMRNDAERTEAEIPEAKKSIEDCADAIGAAMRKRGLIVGDLSRRFIVDPLLYYNVETLTQGMQNITALGSFKRQLDKVEDKEAFREDVLDYAKRFCKTDVEAAYDAIMSVIKIVGATN